MVNFQDGWLLPHPPDLRQKALHLKRKVLWVSPPARRTPVDGLAQQVQGWIRKYYTTVVSHPVLQTHSSIKDFKNS